MFRFDYDEETLNSMAGGRSAIDIPKLNIHSREEAIAFLRCYGFDLQKPQDVQKLWYYHRRAVVLLTEKLGFRESEMPERLRDQKNLQDMTELLILASSKNPMEVELQRWACAFLRAMHVFVHAESDLFSSFSEEIQSQILSPFQDVIVMDGANHKTWLKSKKTQSDSIELVAFQTKPFKASLSTVIKLLAKPDALAMKIFDKLGVRFVTHNVLDSFRVMRFLVNEHLISFPQIMPDQSSNNVYPVRLFIQVCTEAEKHNLTYEKFNELLQKRLREGDQSHDLFRKPNDSSSQDFRFIKFITRQLIHIAMPGKGAFSFFFPFEVQIMDQSAYDSIQSGPSEHKAYKERQMEAARSRLFPRVKS